MRTENELVKEFRMIKQEYAYDDSVMNEEDPRVTRLKKIIDTKLSQEDKVILLLYIDCLSYRELGEKMKLSTMTCWKMVHRIIGIVKEEYENLH